MQCSNALMRTLFCRLGTCDNAEEEADATELSGAAERDGGPATIAAYSSA